MVAIVFLVIFGGILVGFMVYLWMFRKGRKGQAPRSEVNAQRQEPVPGRGMGRGDD